MSVNLISNPVIVESGIIKNVFAGFERVEFGFKREDLQITGVGQGIDNQILINTPEDLSGYLEEGDFVYVYSAGATYTYDTSGQIVAISSTTITITGDFDLLRASPIPMDVARPIDPTI